MMKFILITMMAFAVISTKSNASPFCLAGIGLTPQCIYDDVETCLRATEPPNTSCITNPQSYIAYNGSSSYCVVESTIVAQCLYIDRSQCNEQAGRSGGICVDRTSIDSQSPYQFDTRVQGN